MSSTLNEIRHALKQSRTVMVLSHVRPDGDAIGSLLGLCLSLQAMGKQAVPVLADGVPQRFSFLPGSDQVQTKLAGSVDYLIAVDCADASRLGFPAADLPRAVDLNIDHHPTNTLFAQHNIVRPEAAATTQILYDLAPELGLPMDHAVATNLLTGLITDTIGFRTPNVTPQVLRIAAALEEQASALAEVHKRALSQRSYAAAKYWGYGLSGLQQEDGLVWTELRMKDRQRAGYEGSDDADLVSLLSTIEGAEVAMILIEQSQDQTKVSWRAMGTVDVSRVAKYFGGGGHAPAAGAMVQGGFEQVREQVLQKTRAILKQKQTELGP